MQHPDLSNKHPSIYTVFYPNPLISSRVGLQEPSLENPRQKEKRLAPLTVNEFKLSAIISYVVRNSPSEQKYYSIKYSDVINEGSLKSGNKKKIIQDLRDSLHLRFIQIDKKYASYYFTDVAFKGDSSFTPFITVLDDHDSFKLEIHSIYKTILRSLENGYTRADLDTLKGLTTTSSHILYYEIRQRQSMNKKWQVSLEELKFKLYLQDKYPQWSDFEKRVLKKVQEDFKNTWVAFDYEPVKDKFTKVIGVLFQFNKGPMEEKDIPAGYDFKWEKTLLNYGVSDYSVRMIRNYIKSGVRHMLGFDWDESYVIFSIDAFREELVRKNKVTRAKRVKSPGAYLYQGLMNGYWLQYVADKKSEGQLVLLSEEDMKLKIRLLPENQLLAVSASEPEDQENTDHTGEWKNLYEDLKDKYNSFEEFLNSLNKKLDSGKVVNKIS